MKTKSIPQILQEISSTLPSESLLKNNLDPSKSRLYLWKKLAKKITSLLDENSVKYTLMKAYDVPWAFMTDVDLLIENEMDMLKTITILKNENYNIEKLQFFYPNKATAKKPEETVIVDLYYKPKWYDFTYAPKGLISSSHIRGKIHDVNAFIPTPELNIYLVATHGYCHGRLTLEEILHIANIICKEKPDLLTLLPLIRNFRTCHALYCYMWLVKTILKEWFGLDNTCLESFLKILQQDSVTLYYKKWIESLAPFEYRNFPIYIPLKNLIFSSLTKLSRNNLDNSVKRYDELQITARHIFFFGFLYGQIGKILTMVF